MQITSRDNKTNSCWSFASRAHGYVRGRAVRPLLANGESIDRASPLRLQYVAGSRRVEHSRRPARGHSGRTMHAYRALTSHPPSTQLRLHPPQALGGRSARSSKMLILIPFRFGSDTRGLPPSPITKTLPSRVAYECPAVSFRCTMSKLP